MGVPYESSHRKRNECRLDSPRRLHWRKLHHAGVDRGAALDAASRPEAAGGWSRTWVAASGDLVRLVFNVTRLRGAHMRDPRMIGGGILLGVLVLMGCAAPRLVPLADGAFTNPELGSTTRTEQGVTVTIRSAAWRGRPTYLERDVTTFHVVVQNDTATSLSFSNQDLALFDDQRIQYNPLHPETVAQILKSDPFWAYPRPAFFRPVFLGHGFHPFPSFHHLHDPFFPWWWFAAPAPPERWDDVFTEALIPGGVRSNARVQGFVYFRKLPPGVQRVELQIGFAVEGEPGRHEMSFPFALQSGQTWTPGE